MNLDRVLKSLLSSPASAGLAGAVAGGLLASKGGRKIGKKALQVGGMAAIAGLAYTAWQRHQRESALGAGAPGVEPSSTQIASKFSSVCRRRLAIVSGSVVRAL